MFPVNAKRDEMTDKRAEMAEKKMDSLNQRPVLVALGSRGWSMAVPPVLVEPPLVVVVEEEVEWSFWNVKMRVVKRRKRVFMEVNVEKQF